MTRDYSIIGIDGSGKSTISYELSKNLSSIYNNYSILKLGHPNYYFKNKNKEILNFKIIEKAIGIGNFFQKSKSKILNGFYNIGLTLINDELNNYLINIKKPDIILYARDQLFSSYVYSSYYVPFFDKILSKNNKYFLIDNLISKSSKKLFYLDIDPKLSYERILKRALNEKKEIHLHETLDNLKKLREIYLENLIYFEKNYNYKFEVINVNNKSKGEIVYNISYKIIKDIEKEN